MRILVDKLPNKPSECIFSKRDCEYGIICTLPHGNRCIKVNDCNKLLEISQMKFMGYCKECGSEVYEKDRIPKFADIYECPKCSHPHSKYELCDEVPTYIIK